MTTLRSAVGHGDPYVVDHGDVGPGWSFPFRRRERDVESVGGDAAQRSEIGVGRLCGGGPLPSGPVWRKIS